MNGSRAKALRFIVYGFKRHRKEHPDNDPSVRNYHVHTKTGQVVDTGARQRYQALKKQYKEWIRGGRKHGN